MSDDDRLKELELRHMEQAELLSQLNEAMIGQQRELDRLRAEVEQLKKRLEASEPGLVDAAEREKPPHY